jgi:hypothetical protein
MGLQGGSAQQQQEGEEQEKKKSHHGGWMGVALGAAAGLAGGAFLMHEGHEVKEDFEEDKDRTEERVDEFGARAEDRAQRFGDDVEDAPEDAARWTGEKVCVG